MSGTAGAVFRSAALRGYLEERERSVLPRFVSPRIFLALWVLLALFVGAGLTAWLARVPVYAAGPAVVVPASGSGRGGDDAVLALFLPAGSLPRLRAGQSVFLHLDGAGTPLRRPVLAVEPEVSSPSASRGRFALEGDAGRAIGGPAAVVLVDPAPLPFGLPVSAYAGGVYRGEVEIGRQRAISLVPVIGALFGG